MAFPYFADQEAAWLLGARMPAEARIADLRKSDMARLLSYPLLRALLQGSGDGIIRADDLRALANGDMRDGSAYLSAAQMAFGDVWQDYELSFAPWGTNATDWDWQQMSRKGGNLVVQVNFPSEHSALMGQHLTHLKRSSFEFAYHPVRQTGRPTLAWARLDICMETGEALIEEVQCDWLRAARWMTERPSNLRDRELRNLELYNRALIERYAKSWAKVSMFAALKLLREELGMARVFMHRPEGGKKLKGIYGAAPPRSFYTHLPKSFCFA